MVFVNILDMCSAEVNKRENTYMMLMLDVVYKNM